MKKSIKGTETEKNLLISFAGEGQARNRYTFWASKAKKEGYVQISNIFTLTANQEKEHAERFFKFLEGGELKIEATYPAGIIASTLENLQQAAQNEREEGDLMYPAFADIADKEGFHEIATVWRNVSIAERAHEKRYMELADNLRKGSVFHRPTDVIWQCSNCGYTMQGENPPERCPSCDHEKAYFELMMHNW
ncbi:MAG: rubrerythrin family protein [Alphaproteobacteria bacterium]|nr:rubrerythrin family protein [Alphaproteobacteria bacterium]